MRGLVYRERMAPVGEEALTAAVDSIAADTVSDAGNQLLYGLKLTAPKGVQTVYTDPAGNAMSWIVVGLILLFVITCLRYRKNSGYFVSLFRNVMEGHEQSTYDSTVRETSFLMILNTLWCVSVGVLLYALVVRVTLHGGISVWTGPQVKGVGICMAVAVAYTIFLTVAYRMVGLVFADSRETSVWVGSYLSTQAISGVFLFPLAVIGFAVPGSLGAMLIAGGIVFVVSKFIFFIKGYGIFFSKNASWVLFLYYLCSLEIVPMVLAYTIAAKLTVN